MAKFRARFNKNFNITRVVKRLAITLISLWVGGIIVNKLGDIMLNECSPFFEGLSLIGWTVNSTGCVTNTTGSGILVVVGIIGIASIVMEFVSFSWN